jgi:CheY-like chemotaxis protein
MCVAPERPSLILLDLTISEMVSCQFLAEVRQHPGWRPIPVVVITAKDLSEANTLFLSGSVKRMLTRDSFSRDDLLRCAAWGSGEGTAIASAPGD